MKFTYQKSLESILYPIIELRVGYQEDYLKIFALIDSGATISIFKQEIADILGIKIESGKEVMMRGVAGRIQGYIHNVKVKIAGKDFVMPVVFSKEYLVSFNLLGRSAFFEQFKITFDEKNKLVELI